MKGEIILIIIKETNADRVRRMTDEELASFLLEQEYEACMHCGYNIGCDDCDSNCSSGYLKWLKSEV